jgi:hypothetical protein
MKTAMISIAVAVWLFVAWTITLDVVNMRVPGYFIGECK